MLVEKAVSLVTEASVVSDPVATIVLFMFLFLQLEIEVVCVADCALAP